MNISATHRFPIITSFAAIALLLSISLIGCGEHEAHTADSEKKPTADTADHEHATSATSDWPGDPYLLTTDAVTGESLPDEPVILTHEGREFRFASSANQETFLKNPDQYIPAVDEQMIEAQLALYPLTTCPIAKAQLGSMGDPIDLIYKNRLVRFCCAGCDDKFKADPDQHIAALDDAVKAAQRPDYPTDTCVVSGEKLGDHGETIERVYGNRLIRFCCPACESDFKKNPAAYLAKLNAATN